MGRGRRYRWQGMNTSLSKQQRVRSIMFWLSLWFFCHGSAGVQAAITQSEDGLEFDSEYSLEAVAQTGEPTQDAMVLVFDTRERGQSVRTVTLPFRGVVDVTVDWGDGSEPQSFTTSGDKNHTYAMEGEYTVTITGTKLEQFGAAEQVYANAPKLRRVESFGNLGLQSLSGAFNGAENLTIVPDQIPETVTDLSFMFKGALRFNDPNIALWNVEQVTDMRGMFDTAEVFNQNIAQWNVSRVTDMSYMFANAINFNKDIGAWNVGNVTDMSSMFRAAVKFNQDISAWRVDNVNNMFRMFSNASDFNQDISDWVVNQVTDMGDMFFSAISFNQDISSWNVSSVGFMDRMFQDAASFDQNLANWNLTSVFRMDDMFLGVTLSTQNYSNMLISWADQPLLENVMFHGGNSKFFLGAALAGRTRLIDDLGWYITDGGLELPSLTQYHLPASILRSEPFVVATEFQDASGKRYEYNGQVSIDLVSGTGALQGPLQADAVNGLVVFDSLAIEELDTYEFRTEITFQEPQGTTSTFTSEQTSPEMLVTALYSGGPGRGDSTQGNTDVTLGGDETLLWLGGQEAAEQDWFINANWRKNRVPEDDEFILIPSSDHNPVIAGAAERSVRIENTLNLRGGAQVILQPGPSLTIAENAHVVTEQGTDPNLPALVLKSGARFVDKSSERPLLEIHRQLGSEPPGAHVPGAGKGWRMLASPLETDYGKFTQSIITQGFPGADLPEQNPDAPVTFAPNVLWWDEAYTGSTLQGWRTLNHDENGTHDKALSELEVPAGRGHLYYNFDGVDRPDESTPYLDALPLTMVLRGRENAFADDNGTLHFMYADVNSGSAHFPITYTPREQSNGSSGSGSEHSNNSSNVNFIDRIEADQGWNLLGNPTASALAWNPAENNNDAWSLEQVDHTIYIWDPSANDGAGDYLTWNGVTGSLPNNLIAPFQAFWVKASGEHPRLSFTNAAKSTAPYTFIGGDNQAGGSGKSMPAHPEDAYKPVHPADSPAHDDHYAVHDAHNPSTHHVLDSIYDTFDPTYADNLSDSISGSSESLKAEVVEVHLSGAGMSTRNWLMFSEAGAKAYDRHDAFRLEPLEDTWISSATAMEPGGPSLAINSLPTDLSGVIGLPLYVGAARNGALYKGEFELQWTIPDNWQEGRSIILMDHEERVSIDMLDERSYRFGHTTEMEMVSQSVLAAFKTSEVHESNASERSTGEPSVVYGLPTLPGRIAISSPFQRQTATVKHTPLQSSGVRKPEERPDQFHSTLPTKPGGSLLPKFTILLGPSSELTYVPYEPTLRPNYPNPFNPVTTIPFTISSDQRVRIEIFDVLGRRVTTLLNSDMPSGVHEVRWDASRAASGVYIVRMVTDQGVISRKMTLLR